MNLNRREAVIKLAVLMGATVVGPRLLAANFGRGSNEAAPNFSADDIALLDEIGETIIPATDVPGAKATGIGSFITMMVRDCYPPRDQAAFKEGLAKIAHAYETRYGGSFLTGASANRTALLAELDHEQRIAAQQHQQGRRADEAETDQAAPHYFRVMKELTVLGYFSSEIGCMHALRFVEVPGTFDGSAPYKKGEHAWFNAER